MQAGDIRIFSKSGNEVQLISLVVNSTPRAWVVKRTAGQSAGKQMICLERCLLTSESENLGKLRVVGEQHERFEDTLPK